MIVGHFFVQAKFAAPTFFLAFVYRKFEALIARSWVKRASDGADPVGRNNRDILKMGNNKQIDFDHLLIVHPVCQKAGIIGAKTWKNEFMDIFTNLQAKYPIFKAIVAGFRRKVALKNRTLGVPGSTFSCSLAMNHQTNRKTQAALKQYNHCTCSLVHGPCLAQRRLHDIGTPRVLATMKMRQRPMEMRLELER